VNRVAQLWHQKETFDVGSVVVGVVLGIEVEEKFLAAVVGVGVVAVVAVVAVAVGVSDILFNRKNRE